MSARAIRRVTSSIVVTLVLAGCSRSAGVADEAPPPAPRGTERAQCTAADPEGELILHPRSLTVAEDTTLVDVALLDAVNLSIVEQAVTGFTGNPEVQGVIRDYPPLKTAGLVDSLADWDQRRPLSGLALTATDGQQAVLVALRLDDPTLSGRLVGVTLTSEVAGTVLTQEIEQPVLVQPPGAVCTFDDVDATREWVP